MPASKYRGRDHEMLKTPRRYSASSGRVPLESSVQCTVSYADELQCPALYDVLVFIAVSRSTSAQCTCTVDTAPNVQEMGKMYKHIYVKLCLLWYVGLRASALVSNVFTEM